MNSAWRTWSPSLIAGLFALAVSAYAWPQSGADGDDFRVTLLGTGSPPPVMNRFGPGVLVQAGGQTLLIDCGRGVTQRLFQLGVKLGAADKLFITHLHSDHIVGIPDLWLTGWLESHFGTRKTPYRVIGPTGARELMESRKKSRMLVLDARRRVRRLASLVFPANAAIPVLTRAS